MVYVLFFVSALLMAWFFQPQFLAWASAKYDAYNPDNTSVVPHHVVYVLSLIVTFIACSVALKMIFNIGSLLLNP